jgi:hypothetical protein
VEQLDPISGAPIRLFESISQASSMSGIPVQQIQQALAGRSLYETPGGYYWRYADEATVAASKQLWEQRSHSTKVGLRR